MAYVCFIWVFLPEIQQFSDFQKTLQDVSIAFAPVLNVYDFWLNGLCHELELCEEKKIKKGIVREESGNSLLFCWQRLIATTYWNEIQVESLR